MKEEIKENQNNINDLKCFPLEAFLKNDFYVDILIDDIWHQGYIKEEKPNNKYDIIYLSLANKTLVKTNISKKGLSFFGDNYYQNDYNIREIFLNSNFKELEMNQIFDLLINKLTEINIDYKIIENMVSEIENNGNIDVNIFEKYESNIDKNNPSLIIKDDNDHEYIVTGFYTYQFFSGFFIDVIVFINNNLEIMRKKSVEQKKDLYFDENLEKLLYSILNIIIFVLFVGNNETTKIKDYVQFNRKNIIINKICSIIASIESILSNILIFFCYEFFEYPKIEAKLKVICSLCYKIILKGNNGNKIFFPIQFLVTLINFVIYEDNIGRIENFDKNKIYKVFLSTLQNIDSDDIKYIKNLSQVKVYCNSIIKRLYKNGKNVLINNCYYSFLINCLRKSNILEKKIKALNCINDIIIDLIEKEDEINMIFNDFFINKNKIMDIFFEEAVHEEILKSSIELFKYLSLYNMLSDDLINKLIVLNGNNTVRNILCEIIKNYKNVYKKNQIFKKITKDYNFDNNDNNNNIIEFVSKLTLACFTQSDSQNENNNILSNNITNGNTSNDASFYNKKIVNDNMSDSKRISINMQFFKMGAFSKKNKKSFSRNISSNSLEKFWKYSSSYRKNNRKKNSKSLFKKIIKRNYYGLELLFNYIIYDYDEMKSSINNSNLSKAIKSFKYILDSTLTIKISDIYYFLDKLLENLNFNKKNNSVQSLLLIKILLNKLLCCNNKKNVNIYNMPQNPSKISLSEMNIFEEEGAIISELDDKYDIITLIINDLIRYINKVNENKKKGENYKNNVFEGIYSYMENISTRLKLIFLFVNFGLLINDEHINKIYTLFNSDNFIEEKLLFFQEITDNINVLNYETLEDIFTKFFLNNSQFDKTSFDNGDTFYLIKKLFININLCKGSLIDDTKTKRVNQDLNKLEGIDFLFDILILNKNRLIRNQLCKILSKYCFQLSNYKKEFCSKYWDNYINKIVDLMDKCNKNKNINGILGLIELIESIYNYDFSGKIPSKEDTHMSVEPYRLFYFCCPQKNNKVYKLRVGKVDKILHMRWKLAYFYDICVNDLVICDYNNKEYNFTFDNQNFYQIFPPKKYLIESTHQCINVYEYPGQLSKIPNNPNELIEKNEKIIDIIIDNLNMNNFLENNKDEKSSSVKEKFLMKNKIWNILQKLPKTKYIEKTIKRYGETDSIGKEELYQLFNVNNIYILTFNLQCILNYLYTESEIENKKKKSISQINEFLDKFINIHHIDRTLYNSLINIDINNNLNDNNKYIYLECIKSLLELVQLIEEYKRKKTITSIFITINKDKETIQTKFDNLNESNKEDDLDTTKVGCNFYIKDTILEVIGYKNLYNKLIDIIIFILNDTSSKEKIYFNVLQELIRFIGLLQIYYSNNTNTLGGNNSYQNFFEYIFENEALFKKIFIFDFIQCQKEEVKKSLSNILLNNLFNNYLKVKSKDKSKYRNGTFNIDKDKKNNIKKFFEIILTKEMFDYLVENQKNGSYFNLISSIIEKYIIYNKKITESEGTLEIGDNNENNIYEQNFKRIIDSIIDFIDIFNNKNCIYNEKNNNKQTLLTYPYDISSLSIADSMNSNLIKNKQNNNDSMINGILLYLLKILDLSSNHTNSVIDYFLTKIDICDFFLTKGILNKSNENNLFINQYININTHKIIFHIIIFALKYIDSNHNIINEHKYLEDSLYMKIWNILNKYHKLGFWRKNNFEITYNDPNRKEFIGLKNMSSTCYMNSILQQFFMIPMLRETILSIGSEDKNNLEPNTVLYQLQLLFASLKIYQFRYYDPKNFVIISKLSFYEQMDADEYYSQLIDKIETDISNIFGKGKNNIYKDLFKYFFGIKLTDELFFKECNHKRFNESFCYNIQLEVKNYSNINDSLKNYFKIEIMSGENKINCEECNTKRVCHKQLKIKNLPNILVISLKRFDYDYRKMIKFKLNNYFEFPFELDMSEFIINSDKNNTIGNIENNTNENNLYELTGVTIHYGVADYGHYYDIIKAVNNKWYIFNDTNVKEFNETDIPKEAFGERDIESDLDSKISEKSDINHKDKKNAYILIYTKKTFKKNFQKNNEYSTKLIFPPYNKFSNINNEMKSIINYKTFKYWAFENLTNLSYQNFILELLKMDLAKNIGSKIDKEHINLIEGLKNEGYIPTKNYIKTDNTIFSFGLLYFCNIMLKASKAKNNINICKEILTVYLENDIDKCLYVLEEFSDTEIMDDFFIICRNEETTKSVSEIISISFENYLSNYEHENEPENKKLNMFKFLNSIILFISNKTNTLYENINSLDKITKLFYDLIDKKEIFLKYLKMKGIDNWLEEIIKKINNTKTEIASNEYNDNNDEEEHINMNIVLTESNLPKLESAHNILKEKTNEFDFVVNLTKKLEIESSKKTRNSKKGKTSGVNSCDSILFLKRIQDDIRVIK